MHEILKRVWEEEQTPEEWKKGEIVPIHKQKGDPLACGNFRGITLLEHGMKIFEKIVQSRLRKLFIVNNLDLVQGNVQQIQYLSYNNCKKNTQKCTKMYSSPA